MEVEAQIWYWHPDGMRRAPNGGPAFIERGEVVRLLEEAHERGRQQGLEQAKTVITRDFR